MTKWRFEFIFIPPISSGEPVHVKVYGYDVEEAMAKIPDSGITTPPNLLDYLFDAREIVEETFINELP